MRYYDKETMTEVFEASSTTLPSTDSRVSWWFEPLPDGYMIICDDEGMPYKFEAVLFIKPIVVNGKVVEGVTQEELHMQAKQAEKHRIETEINDIVITYNSHKYVGSYEAQHRLANAYTMAGMSGDAVAVFDIDDNVVLLSVDDLKVLGGLISAKIKSII